MLSVGDAPAIVKTAVLLFKAAERDLRNRINRETRAVMNPVWRGLVALHATTPFDYAVIAVGARIQPGNPPVAVAATSRKVLKSADGTRRKAGGFIPAEKWYAAEFGANRAKEDTYGRTSPRGTRHQVTRHTARQLPVRRRQGRVAHEALKDIVPRLVSLWVHIIVRTYSDAAEGKRN
jgi:hypothetical protein